MSATYVVDVVHFLVAARTVDVDIGSLLAIRSLRVTFAIDDFGTGFSSLSYLAKIPVDTLKIDRSFVVDMVATTGGLPLVPVIINLAHALRLNTVAEGVETEEQLRQLRAFKGAIGGFPLRAAKSLEGLRRRWRRTVTARAATPRAFGLNQLRSCNYA